MSGPFSSGGSFKRFLLPRDYRNAAVGASSRSRQTFWRSLQTFALTRVVIAIVLLIYFSFNTKKSFWEIDQALYWQIAVLYLLVALGFLALAFYLQRRFLLQLLFQIVIDIGVISLMYISAGGAKSGLAILYLFPLAGGAILAPLVWALFFVSLVTLLLLAESGFQVMQSVADASISQAGLYGAAFFAAVWVINRLAIRLIKQEELATRHGQDLQLQQAINRLVIADMGDGMLVASASGAILTANPAAERMLGMAATGSGARRQLTGIATLAPIAEAFFAWKDKSLNRTQPEAATMDGHTTFVIIKHGDEPLRYAGPDSWEERRDLTAHLRLRFVRVDTPGLAEDWTLIFLQDVTEIENQAQQLKLASMGRLTASIAHEVRNPLSAISYATGLLSEDNPAPGQQRLLAIVGDNVARLNRMIEDILKLSRKAQPQSAPVELSSLIAEILAEFREMHGFAPDLIHLGVIKPVYVRFDALHLREVVVNLLTNAVRYASGASGSIRIRASVQAGGRLALQVQDDGPPISPEVRSHLFEPFYTTSSKGTGLGLYLARELCLNNGAMLDYEYHMDDSSADNEYAGGRFVITLAIVDSH